MKMFFIISLCTMNVFAESSENLPAFLDQIVRGLPLETKHFSSGDSKRDYDTAQKWCNSLSNRSILIRDWDSEGPFGGPINNIFHCQYNVPQKIFDQINSQRALRAQEFQSLGRRVADCLQSLQENPMLKFDELRRLETLYAERCKATTVNTLLCALKDARNFRVWNYEDAESYYKRNIVQKGISTRKGLNIYYQSKYDDFDYTNPGLGNYYEGEYCLDRKQEINGSFLTEINKAIKFYKDNMPDGVANKSSTNVNRNDRQIIEEVPSHSKAPDHRSGVTGQ